MVAFNVTSHDYIDAERIVFFANVVKQKTGETINLTRGGKVNNYIVLDDNTVYQVSASLTVLLKRFKMAFRKQEKTPPQLIKVTPYAYAVAKDIVLITDTLTPLLRKKQEAIDIAGQLYSLNKYAKQKKVVRINDDEYRSSSTSLRAKSFVFIEGKKEMFLLKSIFSKDTLIKYTKEEVNNE